MNFIKLIVHIEARLKTAADAVRSRSSSAALSRLFTAALIGAIASPLMAQGTSPWEQAVSVLQASFTGPIARGLSLVSIVVGGLMFAFDEGGSKRMLAGIIFGVGMAIGAVNFMSWLFQ
jgi:type IV secretion system protein TrbC